VSHSFSGQPGFQTVKNYRLKHDTLISTSLEPEPLGKINVLDTIETKQDYADSCGSDDDVIIEKPKRKRRYKKKIN
jgi:hypothetical protein